MEEPCFWVQHTFWSSVSTQLRENAPFAIVGDNFDSVLSLDDSGRGAGADQFFLASGHCMSPVIQPGDRLRVVPLVGTPRPGWIVVFPLENRLRAHRVIRVKGDQFWSRGDNMLVAEGPNPVSSILGRVSLVERQNASHPVDRQRDVWIQRGFSTVLLLLRKVRARWPERFGYLEKLLLGSRLARASGKALLTLLGGEIQIVEEHVSAVTFAESVSHLSSVSEAQVRILEEQLKFGRAEHLRAITSGGRRLGAVILTPVLLDDDLDAALVFSISVSPFLRGLGIGDELLQEVIVRARRKGYRRICAAVRPDNYRSLALFRKKGFNPTSLRELKERRGGWAKVDLDGKLWLELPLAGRC